MSLAQSQSLQTAIYGALTGDATVTTLSGGAIYDAAPPGTPPELFVLIGEDDVQSRADATGVAARHELIVSVVNDGRGFADAKALAAAIQDALTQTLVLGSGTLTALVFRRARARRLSDGGRRIDLIYRALSDAA